MAVPVLVFPIPSLKKTATIRDSFNRKYIPGTSKVYSRGRHGGIDIASPKGRVVVAPYWGRIRFPGWGSALGKHLLVVNSNGYGVLYAHLDRVDVKAGQVVTAGQRVGLSGASGQVSGAHLHMEAHPSPISWTRIENIYLRLIEAQKK